MPCSACANHTSWNFGDTLSYESTLVKEKAVAITSKILPQDVGFPYNPNLSQGID